MRNILRKIIWKLKGIMWQSADGNTTVYTNGWVEISDGVSSDMLPLGYCSLEFVDKVLHEAKGGEE